MMGNNLKQQLRDFKTSKVWANPDVLWIKQNRDCLLEQISNTTVEESSSFSLTAVRQAVNLFIPGRLLYATARSLFVFLLIGAVATSGWIASVSATQNCLPGEICYGVKLAAEKTQALVTTVTGSEETKTQMHLEFASRRAEEIKKVVQKREQSSPQNAAVAIKGLQNSIQSATNGLEDTGKKEPEKVMALAKDVNEKAEKIVDTLKEVSRQTKDVDAQLTKEVAETKKIVSDAGLNAIEVAVLKQSEGNLGVSREEVKDMVREKIERVLVESEETKAEAAQTISNASSTNPGNVLTPVLNPLTTVSSSEAVSSSTLDVRVNVKKVMENVAQKVDETSATVKQATDQAKDLVDNNQLLEAIQKVKEGDQATSQAQQIVAEAKQMMKEVLPENTTLPVKEQTASSSLPQTVNQTATTVKGTSSTEVLK